MHARFATQSKTDPTATAMASYLAPKGVMGLWTDQPFSRWGVKQGGVFNSCTWNSWPTTQTANAMMLFALRCCLSSGQACHALASFDLHHAATGSTAARRKSPIHVSRYTISDTTVKNFFKCRRIPSRPQTIQTSVRQEKRM